MKNSSFLTFLLAAWMLCFTLISCDKDDPWAGTYISEYTNFGMGKAHTYITNDRDGNPVEIGIILDKAAFDNFTELSGDDELSIDFPEEAGKTPFKHQYIGFAAHGHEPVGIYDVPHFDLHYYTSSQAERMGISPFDTIQAANMPGPDYFPAAYFPTGLVPQMGVHWIDGTAPELAGASFTETFIWGSFNGKVTFLEPMITKKFIEENHSFETTLKQPSKYDQPGKYYPTKHGFDHDDEKGEYRFYLSGFVLR
ncbi:MAG TPA: hypothetical protein DCF33_22510 [Saprospirales bacterium]|nr:hypothetical protein [Saprospirales bacterium]